MAKFIYKLSIVGILICMVGFVFFFLKVQEENKYLNKLLETTEKKYTSEKTQAFVRGLSQEIYQLTNQGIDHSTLSAYDKWEATSPFNVTTAISLKYKTFGLKTHSVYGPCGTMSRVLLNSLWHKGIPARKLQLLPTSQKEGDGHTMVEFYVDGKWRVIAPSDSSFVWLDEQGEVASREEIKNNPDIFKQIYTRDKNYPYHFNKPRNIRWSKLPGFIQKFFRAILGEKGFQNATTPRLYDRPRSLMMYTFLAGVLFFLCSALIFFRYRLKKKQRKAI